MATQAGRGGGGGEAGRRRWSVCILPDMHLTEANTEVYGEDSLQALQLGISMMSVRLLAPPMGRISAGSAIPISVSMTRGSDERAI